MTLLENYVDKKVLITGGGGFIGSNLTIKLVELGADVSIMDSKLKPYGYNSFNLNPVIDKIKFTSLDIRDKKAVEENISGKDIIFNLAAQVGENLSEQNPRLDYEINVQGHHNLLESCREKNKDVRILFPGSRLQYGKTNLLDPISEDHPMAPITPYAKNKVTTEKFYQSFYRDYGLDTICLRITNPFGPRASITNPEYCIVNWFIGNVLNKKDITIYGDGTQFRDYLFIEDLVDIMLLAGINPVSKGNVYNVGSGEKTLFKDMAQLILNLSGGNNSLKFIGWPEEAKKRETGSFVADISKIEKDLNWSPAYSLEEGLKKTFEYYRRNLSEYLVSELNGKS